MKIKSLLIGSAALMTVSTGSYAAGAVVLAAPEPVEYVRVCDVYGAGFFYIPGTETCLKIGGCVRDDISFRAGFTGYWNRARFAPNFDARSETEWGTLRAYGEVELNYDSGFGVAPLAAPFNNNYFNLVHAFIEVQGASGTFRIGKTENPYARFLGYGAPNFTNSGNYGYENRAEVSYTFNGGNGFSGIIALVENAAHAGNVAGAQWATNVEGGINFKQGWGSIGAIIGYDGFNSQWGAKAVARFQGSNGFNAGLHVMYASFAAGVANDYRVNALQQNWSILGHVGFQASPKVGFNALAQWFDDPVGGGAWAFGANVAWTPVSNLLIRPEIRYQTARGVGAWDGVIRFQRSF